MEYLIPPINFKGRFEVKPPYNKRLNPNIFYTVKSVYNIKSLEDLDIDVLNVVYLDYGLTENDYDNDRNNDVPIIEFESESGDVVYVPASYITALPRITGRVFVNKVLTINLGSLPENLDLTSLKSDIKELVKFKYGINAYIEEVEVSNKFVVTEEEYDNFMLELNKNSIEFGINFGSSFLTLLNNYKVLKDKIKTLVDYINKKKC